MSAPPPGWYPDNRDPRALRWWDGSSWSPHVKPRPGARPEGARNGVGRGVVAGVAGAAGLLCLLVAVGLGGLLVSAVSSSDSTHDADGGRAHHRHHGEHADAQRPGHAGRPGEPHRPGRPATPKPAPTPTPRTWLVTHVVDGDTVDLANGETVRLVGIDTPEVGQCGYERAKVALVRLVEGKRVRLVRVDEDRDVYGRLLRYVDIGEVDAGLRLIRSGLAIARYDSRDGYGRHPREATYVAADRANPDLRCAPTPRPQPLVGGGGCNGYSPCLPAYPPDLDCPDVNGPILVTGSDPHGLDADGDGIACE